MSDGLSEDRWSVVIVYAADTPHRLTADDIELAVEGAHGFDHELLERLECRVEYAVALREDDQ